MCTVVVRKQVSKLLHLLVICDATLPETVSDIHRSPGVLSSRFLILFYNLSLFSLLPVPQSVVRRIPVLPRGRDFRLLTSLGAPICSTSLCYDVDGHYSHPSSTPNLGRERQKTGEKEKFIQLRLTPSPIVTKRIE